MMALLNKVSGIAGLVALAIVAAGATATPSDAKNGNRLRLRCDARGAGEIKVHARYEERAQKKGVRKRFSAEFEADAGGSFSAGQRITFVVDSVSVGTALLESVPGGELAAEVEFDSRASRRRQPFPANFPPVEEGSLVQAKLGGDTLLGCELQ
jgi:hypothetical protein